MKRYLFVVFISLTAGLLGLSCLNASKSGQNTDNTKAETKLKRPASFNRDSAYSYIRRQRETVFAVTISFPNSTDMELKTSLSRPEKSRPSMATACLSAI